MAASKKMVKSGCGVVIKGVDREGWVTISKIAVPLKVGTAMAAEVALKCACSRESLIWCSTKVCVFRKSMSVSTVFSTSNDVEVVELVFARCERHRKRASLQVGVESIRTVGKRVW